MNTERRDLMAGIGSREAEEPKAKGKADGGESSGGGLLKVLAVVLCLGVAGLLLAQYFGVITLWGGTPPEPALTQEQAAEVEKAKVELKKEEQRIEALPPAQRPKPAGS